MTQCVIFDCDGTLVDSEYLCNLGLQEQLALNGVVISAEQLIKQYRGEKLADTLATISRLHDVSLSDDFIPLYRERVDALFDQELKVIDGVEEMLEQLRLPRCTASNAPVEKTRRQLSQTGLDRYFGGKNYSAYDVDAWKPDPKLFLHAAASMGFAPEQCLVVEDSPVGVVAAQAAGIPVVHYDPEGQFDAVPGVPKFGHMRELLALIMA